MKIAGITAEYNPFHKGHELHIRKTREMLGEDTAIVCIMSGNFVQRGEPAMFEKHARAIAAVKGGANLVVELPAPFALASAEKFAFSSMALLEAMRCVSYVSFGSECGSTDRLNEAVELLLSDDFGPALKKELLPGVSFARARQRAMEKISGKSFEMLEKPNNILAVEYLKNLKRLGSDIKPLAVVRHGAGHDEQETREGLTSASAIRKKIAEGESFSEYVPVSSFEIVQTEIENGRGPVIMKAAEQSVLTRLRTMSDEEFALLPDMSEGLNLRFMREARRAGCLEELYEAVKTKRYPLSRIRRAVMCAWLGIRAEDSAERPPYLRVLAADGTGCEILKTAKKNMTVITKPAHAKKLEDSGKRLFGIEAAATDLYALCFTDDESRRGGREWEISPYIFK